MTGNLERTADTRDARPHEVMMDRGRTARLRMPSLVDAARRLERPPPPAIDPDAYALLRAIWRTYPRAAIAWRTVVSPDQLTPERWTNLAEGTPLLDDNMVAWEAAPLHQQHGRLLRLFRSPSFSHLEALGDLKRRLTLHFSEPIDWIRLSFHAEANDPRPEILLGGYILQPFLYAFARHVLPRLDQKTWRRNRCPVCRGGPYHGYLHPQSREKILICGKCQCPWIVPRLTCPFCANTLPAALGYLYREEDTHQRIDYCTVCRSLLPISRYPDSGSPFPLHDHLAMMPLQNAAQRREHDA